MTKELTYDKPSESSGKGGHYNIIKFWSTSAVGGLLIATLIFAACSKVVQEHYVLCSKGKNIYTVDQNNPRVECIAVRGSEIIGTGSFDDVRGFRYPRILYFILPSRPASLQVVQVDENAIVVPGLADAHAHIVENGYMMEMPLAGSKSVQEVIERIKGYLISHPDIERNRTQWIEGFGWDQTKWQSAEYPKAADLDTDPLLKGRFIVLSRVDGHARWVSPAVLDLMPDLPDEVEGGLIVRDGDGNPTGIFVDNAMNFIPIPPWSDAQVAKYTDLTIKTALSYGLTSIHDADTTMEHLNFLKRLADDGNLPIRVYLMGRGSGQYWGNRTSPFKNYGKQGRLTFRSVKLYVDGALGSWGAALLSPYSDRPETTGLVVNSEEWLRNQIRQFWLDGWQMGVHCIGDRANQIILDIYEEILEKDNACVSEWRPRIEHAQIFAQDDLVRFGKLGVIASVQPTHATSDMWFAESRLGPDRIKGAYAYQSLLRASRQGILPLGSDFPVEGVNPLFGFYAAVTRLSVDGTSPHGSSGWFESQKLSREQALKGMTLDAAYASFAENEIGSLSPGKRADFVVFDKDIMSVPAEEILNTKVVATVVDGKVVYGSL